jgi:hypothetical protein
MREERTVAEYIGESQFHAKMLGLRDGVGVLVVHVAGAHRGSFVTAMTEQRVGPNMRTVERFACVVERFTNGQFSYAAVFPSLDWGTWDIELGDTYSAKVTVFNGHVAEVDWR